MYVFYDLFVKKSEDFSILLFFCGKKSGKFDFFIEIYCIRESRVEVMARNDYNYITNKSLCL